MRARHTGQLMQPRLELRRLHAGGPHRSCEVSQSMKLTSRLCTASDSAVGVGTGGGAWLADSLEEDALPFITSGATGASDVPLPEGAASLRDPVAAQRRSALFSSACPRSTPSMQAVRKAPQEDTCWGAPPRWP